MQLQIKPRPCKQCLTQTRRPVSLKSGYVPIRFENAPPLKAYSKRHVSDIELDRRRVNERRNRIETDAVTNKTASV